MPKIELQNPEFVNGWFYRDNGARNDTIKNAQRAADTTGVEQRVWNFVGDNRVLDWTCEPNPRKMRAYGRV
jgi:hypothetical protein